MPLVICRAEAAQIDADGNPFAVCCEAHNLLAFAATINQARTDMADPSQWCQECEELAKRKE